MNNLINKTAFEKMQELKKIYKDKKYIFDSENYSYGNYGSTIYLHKDCKKYHYAMSIRYNVNYDVDNIIVTIEKVYWYRVVDTKKEYIPIN